MKPAVERRNSKILRIVGIILMVFVAIGALPAGYSFITDPSGSGLGATTEALKYSPFSDFLVPGIVLFTCNGILNLLTAALSIWKVRHYPYFIFAQGSILVGWIAFQVAFLQLFNWYHLVFGSIGIVLLVIGGLLMREKADQA
ncbi:MAG: hypothetical protein RLZZ519_2035 [Bacteroidota bacterium]|jgi:hypothetical protein